MISGTAPIMVNGVYGTVGRFFGIPGRVKTMGHDVTIVEAKILRMPESEIPSVYTVEVKGLISETTFTYKMGSDLVVLDQGNQEKIIQDVLEEGIPDISIGDILKGSDELLEVIDLVQDEVWSGSLYTVDVISGRTSFITLADSGLYIK